jgi:hypothetical protein
MKFNGKRLAQRKTEIAGAEVLAMELKKNRIVLLVVFLAWAGAKLFAVETLTLAGKVTDDAAKRRQYEKTGARVMCHYAVGIFLAGRYAFAGAFKSFDGPDGCIIFK